MPEGYLHLTCEQRCQIYALLQSGHSQAHIARQIGVDPSTISRELVRNTGARGYRFKQAHEKASQRREEASDKPRKMTPDLVELIEEKLTQEQWSPDQISGRLAKDVDWRICWSGCSHGMFDPAANADVAARFIAADAVIAKMLIWTCAKDRIMC